MKSLLTSATTLLLGSALAAQLPGPPLETWFNRMTPVQIGLNGAMKGLAPLTPGEAARVKAAKDKLKTSNLMIARIAAIIVCQSIKHKKIVKACHPQPKGRSRAAATHPDGLTADAPPKGSLNRDLGNYVALEKSFFNPAPGGANPPPTPPFDRSRGLRDSKKDGNLCIFDVQLAAILAHEASHVDQTASSAAEAVKPKNHQSQFELELLVFCDLWQKEVDAKGAGMKARDTVAAAIAKKQLQNTIDECKKH